MAQERRDLAQAEAMPIERILRRTLAHALEKGICRVKLAARSDNTRAIRLYERVGFRREGIARAALRFDGRFHDAVQMALLQGPAAEWTI